MNETKPMEQILRNAGCEVKEQEPMQRHTTFHIGGPAQWFACVPDETALAVVLQAARARSIPCRVIGKGSNLLVSDKGLSGVTLCLEGEFLSLERIPGTNRIRCGAGVPLSSLCSFACKQGLAGLEFAWGIPGTAGGAVFMNAGAYGSEMKDVLVSCTHMNRDGTVERRQAQDLGLGYRHSAYQESDAVILSLELELQPGDPEEIRAKMDDLMRRRKEKQPLEYPSAGSVFKRPEGHFAGALIEQCGLKGKRVGGAMVSPKHAGFIVNAGDATCQDVLGLIADIQQTVKKQTGVSLECEVRPIE